MLYPGPTPLYKDLPAPNPAIKALIINYASKGYPGIFFAQQLPTLVIGPQADLLRGCEQNTTFMDYALEVDDLRKAVYFARKAAATDKNLPLRCVRSMNVAVLWRMKCKIGSEVLRSR
jgi:hypothetical protein